MSEGAPVMSNSYEARPLELADGTVRTVMERGSGRPLLLVQGMSGSHLHWGREFIDGLVDAGRHVISVNHVGVAGSTRSGGQEYGIRELAQAQELALGALGIDEPIDVFGISMGGMTAQELALRHPERIRTLVLGCTTPGGPGAHWADPGDLDALVRALQSRDADRALRAAWEINVSPDFAATDSAAFREFGEVSQQSRVSLRVLSEQMSALGRHDARERLGAIHVPTTVAHGTRDRMLPYPNALVLAERIPGAVLETFEGAGHLFFWEDPKRAVQVALETSARAD
jgi:pimeloyl-ACP methyl ester carboxylesterase